MKVLDNFKKLMSFYVPNQFKDMIISHPVPFHYRIKIPTNKVFHLEQTLDLLEDQKFKLCYFHISDGFVLLDFVIKK
jgi:hypothetical protein